jgi:hypothetical protein
MTTTKNSSPPCRGTAGAGTSCLAADSPALIKPSPQAQAQIAALRQDFAIEEARLEAVRFAFAAATKLRHLGENLAVGDDITAARDRLTARENLAGMGLALDRLEAALSARAEEVSQ